jgi:hypothetical protein
MQSKLSDIELIDQTLAGDQSAYADLVKRHQRFVFTLALRLPKPAWMPKRSRRIAL